MSLIALDRDLGKIPPLSVYDPRTGELRRAKLALTLGVGSKRQLTLGS